MPSRKASHVGVLPAVRQSLEGILAGESGRARIGGPAPEAAQRRPRAVAGGSQNHLTKEMKLFIYLVVDANRVCFLRRMICQKSAMNKTR